MSTPHPDSVIGSIAARQHGVVSATQLRGAGFSPSQIQYRAAIGRLHRIHRGVFAVGRPAAEHRGRMAAALLAAGPGSLLSHRAAAVLWGMLDEPGPVIDVSVCRRNARPRDGIRTHRIVDLRPVDRRRESGLPVVSPSLALLGVAETESAADLEYAFNEALLLRRTSETRLKELAHRFRGHRGLKALLPLMRAQEGGFSRQEAEKRLRALLDQAEFPEARRNRRIHGHELDFFWPEIALNIEMDGYRWHSTRQRLNSDRERDLDLQARGIRVQRVSYDQLERPERLVAKLGATFALATQAAEPAR